MEIPCAFFIFGDPMPNNLRAIRNQAECRLWQLAAKSGVSASTLSAIERYDYSPSISTKRRIAHALRVSVEAIWPPSDGSEEYSR